MDSEFKKLLQEYQQQKEDVMAKIIGNGKTRLEAERLVAQMEVVAAMHTSINYCLDKITDKKDRVLVGDALMSVLYILTDQLDIPEDDKLHLKGCIIDDTPIPGMLGDLFMFSREKV